MRLDDLLAQAPGLREIATARDQAGPGRDLDLLVDLPPASVSRSASP